MLLMCKLSATKNVLCGRETALKTFTSWGTKFLRFWNRIRPRDNIVKVVLEIF